MWRCLRVVLCVVLGILTMGCHGGQKIAVETNESVDARSTSKVYYLQTEDDIPMVPNLTLFDQGEFGFSYDVLSSYYPSGTYEIVGDLLTAVTADGKNQYVFRVEEDRLVFVQETSSDISLTDERIGVPIEDGAVFAMEEAAGED